jgi:BirA family biotin operon repressor/biotin-[acetyl-CoA-carboxylase] ligase
VIDLERIRDGLIAKYLNPEIHVLEDVDSTNLHAKRMLMKGLKGNAVIVASTQSSGVGRFGRSWHSPIGGMYMTIVIRFQEIPTLLPLYSIALALSTAAVLEKYSALKIDLKWPNDIQVRGKKIGGILSELVTDLPDDVAVLLGIGLNINAHTLTFPKELQKTATSFVNEINDALHLEVVVYEIVNALDKMLSANPKLDGVVEQYRMKCVTIGKQVIVQIDQENVIGIAVDVKDDGSLIIEDPTGNEHLITAGEVFHIEGG